MSEETYAEEGKDRRRSVLTEADLKAIGVAVREHTKCNLGWTPDEVSELKKHGLTVEEMGTVKKFVGVFNKAATVIGTVILAAIGTALVALVTKGWWTSIASGIQKNGGH